MESAVRYNRWQASGVNCSSGIVECAHCSLLLGMVFDFEPDLLRFTNYPNKKIQKKYAVDSESISRKK